MIKLIIKRAVRLLLTFLIIIAPLNFQSSDILYGKDSLQMKPILSNSMVIWVDDDYNSSTPGWYIDHFNKIQDGINAANVNNIVYVANGTYIENIEIIKPVKLIGENNQNTIIQMIQELQGLHIEADNVTVQNINIQSDEMGGEIIINKSKNVILLNNILSGGIYIGGDFLYEYTSHTLEGNIVNGKPVYYYKNKQGPFSVPSDAGQLIIANCNYITIENMEVENVVRPVELAGSSYNTISENIFRNVLRGVCVVNIAETESKNNMIDNNDIQVCGDYYCWASGIFVSGHGQSSSIIQNNNITGLNGSYMSMIRGIDYCNTYAISNKILNNEFTYCGICIDGSNNLIKSNIISNGEINCVGIYNEINANHINNGGIKLGNYSYGNLNVVINNDISEGEKGIYLFLSNDNQIINNTINNASCGIFIEYQSNNNEIYANNIMNNDIGVYIKSGKFENGEPSNDNKLYCNNFISNYESQAFDECANVWNDNVYGGNYWDDFEQNIGYPDYYIIEGGNEDWGSVNPYQTKQKIGMDVQLIEQYDLLLFPNTQGTGYDEDRWFTIENVTEITSPSPVYVYGIVLQTYDCYFAQNIACSEYGEPCLDPFQTMIRTPGGSSKELSDIEVGDLVVGCNPEYNYWGNIGTDTVIQVQNSETNTYYELLYGSSILNVTEEHPLWVKKLNRDKYPINSPYVQ